MKITSFTIWIGIFTLAFSQQNNPSIETQPTPTPEIDYEIMDTIILNMRDILKKPYEHFQSQNQESNVIE